MARKYTVVVYITDRGQLPVIDTLTWNSKAAAGRRAERLLEALHLLQMVGECEILEETR